MLVEGKRGVLLYSRRYLECLASLDRRPTPGHHQRAHHMFAWVEYLFQIFLTSFSYCFTLRTIIIVLPPPLTFRTYQILAHTNSYFHCLFSYPDLLPQGPLGYPRGAEPPWYPRSYWRRSR